MNRDVHLVGFDFDVAGIDAKIITRPVGNAGSFESEVDDGVTRSECDRQRRTALEGDSAGGS